MYKYYSGIGALGLLCVILLVIGFTIAGTPISQRDVALDQRRLNDFSTIRYDIENYYRANNQLPAELSVLKAKEYTDPQTNKPYDYKIVSPQSYQLCTSFITDTTNEKSGNPYNQYYDDYTVDTTHTQGYDCIEYRIPSYMLSPTPGQNMYQWEMTPSPRVTDSTGSALLNPTSTPIPAFGTTR